MLTLLVAESADFDGSATLRSMASDGTDVRFRRSANVRSPRRGSCLIRVEPGPARTPRSDPVVALAFAVLLEDAGGVVVIAPGPVLELRAVALARTARRQKDGLPCAGIAEDEDLLAHNDE